MQWKWKVDYINFFKKMLILTQISDYLESFVSQSIVNVPYLYYIKKTV